MGEKIEYETITVRIPKKIMSFLRETKTLTETPEEYLEYTIVDSVRADIDGGVFSDPERIAEGYGLQPVFQAIVNDTVDNSVGR